jgi:hypothetical protein
MLPAEYGDCLWITYGNSAATHQILIDAGTKEAASRFLPRLRNQHFELFVITHIDADHIGGALELLRNMKSLGVTFDDVWFNGWKHIGPFDLAPIHGELLTDNIERQKLNWNHSFDGRAVMVPDEGELPALSLPGGMNLTVLSPTQTNLIKLQKHWRKVITEAGLVPGHVHDEALSEGLVLSDEPPLNFEALIEAKFKSDTAVANGSSIALLAEYDGKRCLFGADAFAPVMAASIKSLLQRAGQKKLKLDAFKLSHHGSKKNTSGALLELLDCNRYLFSSNGQRFQHPDRETVARVIRFGGPSPSLYFNYHTTINEVWENTDLIEDPYQVEYSDGSLLIEL